ncbi:hypothetical protein PVAP13_9KG281313 [Panicum virgatum]|uniref:Uncharacterized protein n=1 Tax=Panicum virgatum TaxID=38727 RepID=A0A8T0NP27_PANVG|nr:hypothetical protein PVAP13_9KG281313 [Panicum virgatum]
MRSRGRPWRCPQTSRNVARPPLGRRVPKLQAAARQRRPCSAAPMPADPPNWVADPVMGTVDPAPKTSKEARRPTSPSSSMPSAPPIPAPSPSTGRRNPSR